MLKNFAEFVKYTENYNKYKKKPKIYETRYKRI